jgi:hypothetical protein
MEVQHDGRLAAEAHHFDRPGAVPGTRREPAELLAQADAALYSPSRAGAIASRSHG